MFKTHFEFRYVCYKFPIMVSSNTLVRFMAINPRMKNGYSLINNDKKFDLNFVSHQIRVPLARTYTVPFLNRQSRDKNEDLCRIIMMQFIILE